MKLKIFALFVALLFVGTATLTAAHPTEETQQIRIIKRFSGNWGFTYCKEIGGRTKGFLRFKLRDGRLPKWFTLKGVLCIDDDKPEGCFFDLKLKREKNPCNPRPCLRRGDMISGVFRGYMRCQWNCEELPECDYEYDNCGCCYDVLCCNHTRGPFTGDWFVYHGWLMIMGTYYGHKIWLKAYIGSWFYPGIECYYTPDK